MKEIEEIWKEANSDDLVGVINTEKYESRIKSGVKIVRDLKSNTINIYDTHTRSDHYRKISAEERKIFLYRGWMFGVLYLSLQAYEKILKRLKKSVDTHLKKGNNNQAYLLALNTEIEFYETRKRVSQVKFNKLLTHGEQITFDF